MSRRDFAIATLGVGAGALSVSRQAKAVVQPGSLKQKVHSDQPIRVASAPANSNRSQLEAIVKRRPVDLLYVDGQHTAVNERELLDYCTVAEELGVGVKFRIKHPRQAFLVGNYADLGPLAILVPLVEDEQTVRDAINTFYFPPLGRRSWAGAVGFKKKERPDRLEYAAWWNANAILCLQIESVRAAVNVRNLVKPGVDWIQFGPGDLSFDLEQHSHSPFKTVRECADYVAEQLKGVDVRVDRPST